MFGEDIQKEYVKNENKLIIKNKEGIYENTENLIGHITKPS